ncbi:pyrimidine/purine nucleoside phosphorylase [uncultured Arcticibacterium sp.]|uniref:pyrimidine/purine nucleoside phosphorylase n=1 Tax=uncultured Arcticibacterium sp. TaxID=2173042 RepID=UPI0030F865F8
MIEANVYFDNNVKSLGYETPEGKSSIGVMEPGEYTFGTGAPEIMNVIQGALTVLLPGETEWKTFKGGEHFNVIGDSSFNVKVDTQTSYMCQYV